MTEMMGIGVAVVGNIPAESWLRAGDTLAGFAPSERFNCTTLRLHRAGHWEPLLAGPHTMGPPCWTQCVRAP